MKNNEQVEIELQKELDAMNDKISRLSEFLGENSGKTAVLYGGNQAALMAIQYETMQTYAGVLVARIDDLEKDELMKEMDGEEDEDHARD